MDSDNISWIAECIKSVWGKSTSPATSGRTCPIFWKTRYIEAQFIRSVKVNYGFSKYAIFTTYVKSSILDEPSFFVIFVFGTLKKNFWYDI